MAKTTWLTIDQAYREWYCRELPSDSKVYYHRNKFKRDVINGDIPLRHTFLVDGEMQISRESIEQYKEKHSNKAA